MPQSGYERIAAEYYDDRHKTSRNFDTTTRQALANQQFIVPQGLILELGAGRGRSTEFLGAPASSIVQLDNSAAMLRLGHREAALLRLNADGCNIPLMSHQFKAVVGFRVDPFFGLDSLAEAYRMLLDGGRLLLKMPTRRWANGWAALNIDVMTTRFKIIHREEVVILPSLLHSPERIREMLALTGFRSIVISSECLPGGQKIYLKTSHLYVMKWGSVRLICQYFM